MGAELVMTHFLQLTERKHETPIRMAHKMTSITDLSQILDKKYVSLIFTVILRE
jgi:hypothetical protein